MKNILVSVVGMTPQVVTETLYGLWLQKIIIDEIYVLTTAPSPVEKFLQQYLPKLARRCKIPQPKFNPRKNLIVHADDENIFAEDVDSTYRSSSFTDLTCRLLFSLTSDHNNIVHCSLAGGRKTMSISMVVAMMLFGRETDTLSHVLVTKEFERSQKAFPTGNDDDQVKLIFVPYIRLRNNLPHIKKYGERTFTELLKIAQQELDSRNKKPSIKKNPSTHSIVFEGVEVKLQPLQYAFYTYLLDKKKVIASKGYFEQGEFEKFYNKINRRISERTVTYNVETLRKLRSEINAKIKSQFEFSRNFNLYKIHSRKENAIVTYFIPFAVGDENILRTF